MKKSRHGIALAFGITLALPAFAAKDTKDKTNNDTVPEGYVMIESFTAIDLKQLPIDLLRAADSDFSNQNLGEASADLRAAGRALQIEAKEAKGTQHHLADAASDLDKLAADVKNEVVKSADAFHARVSQALYHDAEHHRLQAKKEWDSKMYRNAGDDLRASAIATEMASAFSGKDLAAGTTAATSNARKVGMELSENEEWTPSEVRSALSGMENATSLVASKVMPSSDKAHASESPTSL